MPFAIIILILLLCAIAFRQIGRVRLPIWLSMLCAALLNLVTGQISPQQAWQAIDWQVIFYLFGVFVVGQALESSHYLERLNGKCFSHAKSARGLLSLVIIVFGLASALLMNDTVAIIGTPMCLALANKHKMSAEPLLLALAYSITIGSVMSPVGNPQNLLIATHAVNHAFVVFLSHLALPTLLSLLALFFIMWLFYRKELQKPWQVEQIAVETDVSLSRLSKYACLLLIGLIVIDIVLSLVGSRVSIPFLAIALIAAAPILLLSPRRWQVLRDIDWHTLIFFIAMFIVMRSVWNSGYFQQLILHKWQLNVTDKSVIVALSLLLSQLISNVPLVALYLPLLQGASVSHYLLLAMASTMAGCLLLFGAASNVIIVQNAEKRGARSFRFVRFFVVGVVVTVVSVALYLGFLWF